MSSDEINQPEFSQVVRSCGATALKVLLGVSAAILFFGWSLENSVFSRLWSLTKWAATGGEHSVFWAVGGAIISATAMTWLFCIWRKYPNASSKRSWVCGVSVSGAAWLAFYGTVRSYALANDAVYGSPYFALGLIAASLPLFFVLAAIGMLSAFAVHDG